MSDGMATESRLIAGDCLDVMREWDESVIDLTVTSPPYDNMRDYKGFAFEFEAIARELYRVTKKGGVVARDYQRQIRVSPPRHVPRKAGGRPHLLVERAGRPRPRPHARSRRHRQDGAKAWTTFRGHRHIRRIHRNRARKACVARIRGARAGGRKPTPANRIGNSDWVVCRGDRFISEPSRSTGNQV